MVVVGPAGRGADAVELLGPGKLSRTVCTQIWRQRGSAVHSCPGVGFVRLSAALLLFPNHRAAKCGSGAQVVRAPALVLTGGPRNHAREGALERFQLNANSFLPDFLLQLHSYTSWISELRLPAGQNPHTASTPTEEDLHLQSFPGNDSCPIAASDLRMVHRLSPRRSSHLTALAVACCC